MKKSFLLFTLVLGITSILLAQSPASFSYQAVVRDASGQILANQPVEMGVAILQGSANGDVMFSETQSVTTNAFGLVNLEVGSTDPDGFSAIAWGAGPYFLQTSVDGTILGTSQLLSVPYALHATTADSVTASGLWERDGLDIRNTNAGQVVLTDDAKINGLTVGKGEGSSDINTALGVSALSTNTIGQDNVSVGYQALKSNTLGSQNTAIGSGAMFQNTESSHNTAVGYTALGEVTGGYNTAIGSAAMVDLISGSGNVAVGAGSMPGLNEGVNNTAIGTGSGTLTTGHFNVFVGFQV